MKEPRYFAPTDPPSPTEPVNRSVAHEPTEPGSEEREDAERIREQTERAQEKIHQQLEAAARIMGEGADMNIQRISYDQKTLEKQKQNDTLSIFQQLTLAQAKHETLYTFDEALLNLELDFVKSPQTASLHLLTQNI